MDSKYSKLLIIESRWWIYGVYPSQFFQRFCMFEKAHNKILEIKKSSKDVLIAYRAKKPRLQFWSNITPKDSSNPYSYLTIAAIPHQQTLPATSWEKSEAPKACFLSFMASWSLPIPAFCIWSSPCGVLMDRPCSPEQLLTSLLFLLKTCSGDLCSWSQRIKKEGGIKYKIFKALD